MAKIKKKLHLSYMEYNKFDLEDTESEIYKQIKKDYEDIRKVIITTGVDGLSGRMGVYVQPRTKGKGHGSTTRAFYVRKQLLEKIIFKT